MTPLPNALDVQAAYARMSSKIFSNTLKLVEMMTRTALQALKRRRRSNTQVWPFVRVTFAGRNLQTHGSPRCVGEVAS